MRRSAEVWREWCGRITCEPVVTGGRGRVYDSGVEFVRTRLRGHDFLTQGSSVLEVGSGNGRIAMGLCDEPIRYLGLEPVAEAVEFCKQAFADFPDFRFDHLDVANARYNPGGMRAAEDVVFPVDDECVDLVLAVSVFTHLATAAAAARYLDECRRVLKPGGKLYSTWFRSPPNRVAADARRTAYREAWIIQEMTARFEVLDTDRGTTTAHHDQWEIIAVKRGKLADE